MRIAALAGSGGQGATAFGFEIPPGDPAELDQAAALWRDLAEQLALQGESLTAGARLALGAGGWSGPAATRFTSSAERLISSFRADVEAAGQAAGVLRALAQALEQAQSLTRQALAECERLTQELRSQQRTADEAGAAAQTAEAQAAAAVHPAQAADLARTAAHQRSAQEAAQSAADAAGGQLAAAEARGQQAYSTYEREAQQLAARLRAIGGELRPAPEPSGWADLLVTWSGHTNDLVGSGAGAEVERDEQMLADAGKQLASGAEQFLEDPAVVETLPATSDAEFKELENAFARENMPILQALSKGPDWLPSVLGDTLGRVPYLAWGVTFAEVGLNVADGRGAAGVEEPLANLGAGTAIAEGAGALGLGDAAGTAATSLVGAVGLDALAGSAAVPVVGEVVVVGGLVVAGGWAFDKYVWGNREAIVHGVEDAGRWIYHEGDHLLHDATHIVSDLEPWNW